jgi:hypothetical protein
MSKLTRTNADLDFTSGGAIRAEDIPYDASNSVKVKIDEKALDTDVPDIQSATPETANFTATLGERHLINTAGGGFTATLPPAATPGQIAFLIETNSNNQLTIDGNGTELINGKQQLKVRSGATTLESDGAEWHIIQLTGRNPTRIDPAQITANQDPFDDADWDSTVTHLYINSDAERTLQGFEEDAFIEKDEVVVTNNGSFNILIAHDNATTAANSVLIETGTTYTLRPNASVRLLRDGTANKWRLYALGADTPDSNVTITTSGTTNVTEAESKTTYIMTHATGTRTLNLPVGAAIGTSYQFVKAGVGTVTVSAGGSEVIADSAAGGQISNSEAAETYATLSLKKVTSVLWVIMSGFGTWTTT